MASENRDPTEDAGSVTRWIRDLKAGDPQAAEPLWGRYFAELVHFARQHLRAALSPVADEEDAALSAFDSVCRGAQQGRFPRLDHRDDLWRLLVAIAARKAIDQARRAGRQKRGGGRVRTEAELLREMTGSRALGLEEVVGREPTPEFAAMVAEQSRRLFAALGAEELRRIAALRMEGHTAEEIAERLGCARRTVTRRLQLIRQVWLDTAC
jgi:RNA polymerase sigma factor (sigma-70 family)